MIFVTLGSQRFQFDRLLKALDDMVGDGRITEELFAQTGYSDYLPQHYKYKQFLDRDEFLNWQDKCDIVITHGGTGAIVGALKKGKKVIAIPRLSKYGEHVDDHQLQIVDEFQKLGFICRCDDCEKLDEQIVQIKKTTIKSFKSNTDTYVDSLSQFIDSL